MENNEELIQQLNLIKYRLRMLDLIEEKLLKMRALACLVKEKEMDKEEIDKINKEIQRLAKEVNALDEESRVMINTGILLTQIDRLLLNQLGFNSPRLQQN